jgi:hypothetical protein
VTRAPLEEGALLVWEAIHMEKKKRTSVDGISAATRRANEGRIKNAESTAVQPEGIVMDHKVYKKASRH